MTLEPKPGRAKVSLTECPFCDAPIAKQNSFAGHWWNCPENPKNDESPGGEA